MPIRHPDPALLHGPRDKALSEAHLQRLYGVPIRRVAFEGETLVPLHRL
jgi:hypothetical protein